MTQQKTPETFSPEEARKRMEAALRGAKIAGHKAKSEIAPKRNLGKVVKRTEAKKAKSGD